jgi:hypothetical protein
MNSCFRRTKVARNKVTIKGLIVNGTKFMLEAAKVVQGQIPCFVGETWL